MASVLGVSSSLHDLTLEVSRRVPMPFSATLSSSSSLFLNLVDRAHFLGLPVSKNSSKRTIESWLNRDCTEFHVHEFTKFLPSPVLNSSTLHSSSAVSSPNSIISEEAFKGLGLSSGDGLDLSDDYDYEDGIGKNVLVDSDDGNLDLRSLNLSLELVQALTSRGITHLFSIQVWWLSVCLRICAFWKISFHFEGLLHILELFSSFASTVDSLGWSIWRGLTVSRFGNQALGFQGSVIRPQSRGLVIH